MANQTQIYVAESQCHHKLTPLGQSLKRKYFVVVKIDIFKVDEVANTLLKE